MLYDNDDEVTDYTTTSQFEIKPKGEIIANNPDYNETVGICFAFVIIASLVGFIAVKHFSEQDANIESRVVMATSNQTIATSNISPPPNPPKVNISSIPIPYTSLPPGGEYTQVGNATIYSTSDGRTWIQQQDGNFLQN